MTLIPWSKRRALLWDFRCCDTFAKSNIDKSSKKAGRAATIAKANKIKIYFDVLGLYLFTPIPIETLGTFSGHTFTRKKDRKTISDESGQMRPTSFRFQRMSSIQRGNAISG